MLMLGVMSAITVHMKCRPRSTCYNDVFKIFGLFKFVKKIRCPEYYSEFHETIKKTFMKNVLISDSFWGCFYRCHRKFLPDTHLKIARSEVFGMI